eukprot:scaffold14153_cov61-Phaeocystis_antarctica.AAC.7
MQPFDVARRCGFRGGSVVADPNERCAVQLQDLERHDHGARLRSSSGAGRLLSRGSGERVDARVHARSWRNCSTTSLLRGHTFDAVRASPRIANRAAASAGSRASVCLVRWLSCRFRLGLLSKAGTRRTGCESRRAALKRLCATSRGGGAEVALAFTAPPPPCCSKLSSSFCCTSDSAPKACGCRSGGSIQ